MSSGGAVAIGAVALQRTLGNHDGDISLVLIPIVGLSIIAIIIIAEIIISVVRYIKWKYF